MNREAERWQSYGMLNSREIWGIPGSDFDRLDIVASPLPSTYDFEVRLNVC